MTDPGGGTLLTVNTFANGRRIGLTIGSGIGVSPEISFANS